MAPFSLLEYYLLLRSEVFLPYLEGIYVRPHRLEIASGGSVGHGTYMNVLARCRASMGHIVRPKRSSRGATTAGEVHRDPPTALGQIGLTPPTARVSGFPPVVEAPRLDRAFAVGPTILLPCMVRTYQSVL